MADHKKSTNPWSWIPTLYFAQGIPLRGGHAWFRLLCTSDWVLSNAEIALYTSWLYLPWVIKPLWSPLVDLVKTKRWWVVTMQLLVGAGLAGVAFTIPAPNFFFSGAWPSIVAAGLQLCHTRYSRGRAVYAGAFPSINKPGSWVFEAPFTASR